MTILPAIVPKYAIVLKYFFSQKIWIRQRNDTRCVFTRVYCLHHVYRVGQSLQIRTRRFCEKCHSPPLNVTSVMRTKQVPVKAVGSTEWGAIDGPCVPASICNVNQDSTTTSPATMKATLEQYFFDKWKETGDDYYYDRFKTVVKKNTAEDGWNRKEYKAYCTFKHGWEFGNSVKDASQLPLIQNALLRFAGVKFDEEDSEGGHCVAMRNGYIIDQAYDGRPYAWNGTLKGWYEAKLASAYPIISGVTEDSNLEYSQPKPPPIKAAAEMGIVDVLNVPLTPLPRSTRRNTKKGAKEVQDWWEQNAAQVVRNSRKYSSRGRDRPY